MNRKRPAVASGGAEENHEVSQGNWSPARDSNPRLFKYKAGVLNHITAKFVRPVPSLETTT